MGSGPWRSTARRNAEPSNPADPTQKRGTARSRLRTMLASRKTDAHRTMRNSAAGRNAIPSELPRVPNRTTLLDSALVRNPTSLDEPNIHNPVLHAPTLALNSATPRALAA